MSSNRKKKYVSWEIQGKLLSRFATYWTIYHLVLWHAMFVGHYWRYVADVERTGNAVPFTLLYREFATQHVVFAFAALVMLPVLVWDWLLITHRIAGPLFRMQNTLREIVPGQSIPNLKFRQGDLLNDLELAWNEFADKQNKIVPSVEQTIQEDLNAVRAMVHEQLEGSQSQPKPQP